MIKENPIFLIKTMTTADIVFIILTTLIIIPVAIFILSLIFVLINDWRRKNEIRKNKSDFE